MLQPAVSSVLPTCTNKLDARLWQGRSCSRWSCMQLPGAKTSWWPQLVGAGGQGRGKQRIAMHSPWGARMHTTDC